VSRAVIPGAYHVLCCVTPGMRAAAIINKHRLRIKAGQPSVTRFERHTNDTRDAGEGQIFDLEA